MLHFIELHLQTLLNFPLFAIPLHRMRAKKIHEMDTASLGEITEASTYFFQIY